MSNKRSWFDSDNGEPTQKSINENVRFESDSGKLTKLSTRRKILSGIGGIATVGIAGCSDSESSNTDSDIDKPLAEESNVDFEAYVFVPIMMKDGGPAVSPEYNFVELEGKAEEDDESVDYNYEGYDNPDYLALPDDRDVESFGNRYTAKLPYSIYVNAKEDIEAIDSIKLSLSPKIPVDPNYPSKDNTGGSFEMTRDEFIGGKFVTSRDIGGGAALGLHYEQIEADSDTLRPLKIDISIEVKNNSEGVLQSKTETVSFAVPNKSTGYKKYIDMVGPTWSDGMSVASSAAGAKYTQVLYESTKLITAAESGTIDEKLTREAIAKDTAAFSDLLDDEILEVSEWSGGIGGGGAAFAGTIQGISGGTTTNETTTENQESSKPELELIDGRNFDIKPTQEGWGLEIIYEQSGTEVYPISDFKLDVDINDVTGEYPLAQIASDESFNPGDVYRLDKETLGADSELDYRNGGEVVLLYYLDIDEEEKENADYEIPESGWMEVVKLEFVTE